MHGPPLGPMHHGPQSSGGGHSSSRADLSESPRRHVHGSQDVEMGHGTKSPRFILQPPPSDLPHSIGETIPTSLVAKDIANMTEAEAKRMLGVAVRQIRDQQVEMGHVMHDLETLKRVSAQRERDSEARLDVERRSMELDAMVLRRRWKEASDMLLEKDREMKDVQMQLEAGKQFIKERNEERRRRIEEQGVILPSRTTPGKEGLGLTHPAPSTPTTDSSQPGFHPHRHRRTHYHRHHHRHLTRNKPLGMDSLEQLALLATQVMTREPLVITRKGQNNTSENAPGEDYPRHSDKKRFAPEERDRGLQLRPVKRVDLSGIDSDDATSEGQTSKRESSLKTISNGRGSVEAPSKRSTHPAEATVSKPTGGSTTYHYTSTRSGISSTRDPSGRSSSKHRRP